jgi:membrane protein required for colicin V production
MNLNLVDIVIVLVVVLSAVHGYRSGLITSVASLLGLIGGIAIASWQYKRFVGTFQLAMHSEALADAVSFALIALIVMIAASILGMLLKGLVHGVGLGWLDRFMGLLFGFLRGALLITLCIVTLAAFFPDTRWLGDAQLAKYFMGTAHLTTHMTPDELKAKIVHGLHVLEKDTPNWLHPK